MQFTSSKTAPEHWLNYRALFNPQACGDFAQCFELSNHRSAVIVGDVGGRGPVVGMAARTLLAYVRDLTASGQPLSSSVTSVNRFFSRHIVNDDIPLASLFLAIVYSANGVLEYASAGHEPALIFTSRTKHEHLYPTGSLLGLEDLLHGTFEQRTIGYAPGSLLAVVTDGITESRNYNAGKAPHFFGDAGVVRAVVNACGNFPPIRRALSSKPPRGSLSASSMMTPQR
jgi:serine phosphatase RsbU (regulator of sigma subunit)